MVDRVTEVHDMQPPRELTNRDLWRWRVQHTPDRRWLWHAGQTWTYGEFDLEMRRLASGLRELGVGPGTRVLVGMSTRPETVLTHLALGELGAVRVLLVPGLPLDELMFPIVHSEAPMIVADDPIASMMLEHRDACPSIKHLVVLTDRDPGAGADVHRFEELAQSSPLAHEAPEEEDVQALSYVIYTSGSTGRPKGVMLKAGSLYHCGLGYSDLYSFGADDNYFQPLTFGHSLASIAGLGIPMVTGGSVSLIERFRPSTFWSQVQDSGATISVLFPAHLNLLLETDDGAMEKGSSTMRYIVTHTDIPGVSRPVRVALGDDLGNVGDADLRRQSIPATRGEMGPGYVGHPFGGGEVGIFDEKFNRVGPYQYGELCLRHPQVMIGYLKDPEATARTLSDGWVRSGDRGYVDHSGRAFFAGRYKAMIKRSGENVSAEEVEAAILGEPVDVAEVAVVAVPDRLRTEEVGAVVVQRAGAARGSASLRALGGRTADPVEAAALHPRPRRSAASSGQRQDRSHRRGGADRSGIGMGRRRRADEPVALILGPRLRRSARSRRRMCRGWRHDQRRAPDGTRARADPRAGDRADGRRADQRSRTRLARRRRLRYDAIGGLRRRRGDRRAAAGDPLGRGGGSARGLGERRGNPPRQLAGTRAETPVHDLDGHARDLAHDTIRWWMRQSTM